MCNSCMSDVTMHIGGTVHERKAEEQKTQPSIDYNECIWKTEDGSVYILQIMPDVVCFHVSVTQWLIL